MKLFRSESLQFYWLTESAALKAAVMEKVEDQGFWRVGSKEPVRFMRVLLWCKDAGVTNFVKLVWKGPIRLCQKIDDSSANVGDQATDALLGN